MENQGQQNTTSAPPQPPSRLYPIINIPRIENPNRFYAVPIIGFLTKIILLIPFFFWLFVVGFVSTFIITPINSFVVLFTGKYSKFAYNYNLGLMRMNTKLYFYVAGLTDKYPGFGFAIKDNYTLDIPYPENPNRLYAIPIIGGIIRFVLLIPYFIYNQVIQNAAGIGVLISFVPVLFNGRYPESTYELTRDSVRVTQGASAYLAGLSDRYPSFHISMNHQTVKIILIIIGALMMTGNIFSSLGADKSSYKKGSSTFPTQYQLPSK